MSSLQASVPQSVLLVMADISALRCVGCVHVLVGMVIFSMGIVSAASNVYMGWLCVGVWTGISFVSCGAISILTSKSPNLFTVAVMACVSVLTLNFSCICAVITLSSLFPRDSIQEYSHNQTTGTALGILHLVAAFIETVTCGASIKIAWRILALAGRQEGGRRTRSDSYDDPYLSSNNYAPLSTGTPSRRRSTDENTPPPTYDFATHELSTSPKTVVGAGPPVRRYGSTEDQATTS